MNRPTVRGPSAATGDRSASVRASARPRSSARTRRASHRHRVSPRWSHRARWPSRRRRGFGSAGSLGLGSLRPPRARAASADSGGCASGVRRRVRDRFGLVGLLGLGGRRRAVRGIGLDGAGHGSGRCAAPARARPPDRASSGTDRRRVAASSSVMATVLLRSAGPGGRGSAVVLELERHGQVELAQPGDDALQVVPALARHADRVALDLRLDLRELVADQLGDLLGDLLRQAAAQRRSAGGPCCRRPARPCPSRRS